MKVALVHDYIKEYGGAEKVLLALHDIFPEALIYTSVYLPAYLGPHKEKFKTLTIKTSLAQYIPFVSKLISPLRVLSPFLFRSMDLSSFDVIIVSQTGAYFPTMVKKGQAKLICYTHTPPRYLYGYMTARAWKKHILVRLLAEIVNHILRMVDFKSSENVDQFIANSEEVAARIKKFYRKDAVVVYPPVVDRSLKPEARRSIQSQTSRFQFPASSYYLTGGRFARAKGFDIIVKAFNSNGLPLKIFGKGFAGYDEELRRLAKKNIEFVGEVNDEEKLALMHNAKAFIVASYDEDFGITPVESMSVGTPVIAYKSGGVQETVIDGKTGVFYEPNDAKSLMNAIHIFETMKFDPQECIAQAKKFSKESFEEKIKKIVTLKNI